MSTILIVDDAHFIRTRLSETLTKAGYEILGASNGIEAEKLLERNSADVCLVFLDISMPQQDGITTLRNIRERWPRIPVVMLTAHTEKDKVIECARLGMAGFLAKPFQPRRVVEKVHEVLGEKERAPATASETAADSGQDVPSQ